MRHNSLDLVLVIATTCIAVGVTLVVDNYPALQMISGILLVFVLPGYAVATMLFSARWLGFPEWMTVGLGLSLMMVILGGFVLNWLPWGLGKQSWAVVLGGLSLIGSAIAWVRRHKLTQADRTSSLLSIDVSLGKGVVFGFAVLIVVGAVAISRFGALNQAFPGFTQLWMMPIDSGNADAVHLGVRSEELTVAKYSLAIAVGNRIVNKWALIELKPGETWEGDTTLPPQQSDENKIEAWLVRLDAPQTVYRRVLLWRDR